MKDPKLCPHCGAKMSEYCHSMSKSLARVIFRICQNLGPGRGFHVGSCQLTNPQINNLQKLRYWGLIGKAPDATAKGALRKQADTARASTGAPSSTKIEAE